MNTKRALALIMAGLLLPAGALMAQDEGGDEFNVKVTKTFSDDSDFEVDVMLTCDTGLPLEQDATIVGGDTEGVTFVVVDFVSGTMDCEVTETGSPGDYTVVMNDGNGCAWENIELGDFETCEIENIANDATYTVYKDWVIADSGGGSIVEQVATLEVTCDREIVDYPVDADLTTDGGEWTVTYEVTGDATLAVGVDVTGGTATCSAEEKDLDKVSAVEQSSAGQCSSAKLGAGGSASCTFTNTVFFEGIPTLSQYGLAIMALLMLGVGYVGFRRFI